uniref:TNFAIP3 interacting protein 1 n=1 Tax=Molossus molossus TaxID=27622 RepID=A0A7J8IEU9_MOLMO|nr:TNFAIP3 interacting protein 1 [Molossus molossus]
MPAMMPHHGFEEWSQIRYPPPPMAMEHPPPLPNSRLYHLPEYTWRPPCGGMRNQTSQVMDTPTARPAEPGKHGPLVESFGRISAVQKQSGLCQEVVGPFTKVCEPRLQTAWRECAWRS